MGQTEDTRHPRDIIQSVVKAKKTLRMYPANNPIYTKTLEELYFRFEDFFHHTDTLSLKIKQHSIFHDSEEIYQNPEKEDNLALFFFKDGLRELTFRRGLLQEELEGFLKVIAMDFDNENLDDDVVTLLWERDFQNIEYVVDDSVLLDPDGEEYEMEAVSAAKRRVSDIEGLMRAYVDEFSDEGQSDLSVIPVSDKDLQTLMKELESDSSNKIEKLTAILFEMLYHDEDVSGIMESAVQFFKETIKLSLREGNVGAVIRAMKRAKEIFGDPASTEKIKKNIGKVLLYLGSDDVTSMLHEILDGDIELDDAIFREFIALLDKRAILPFVKLLGEVKTLKGRKKVMEALVFLGRQDIKTLASSLGDHNWLIVKDVIAIIKRIRDKGAIEYLLKAMTTEDIRIKKEIIRAIAEIGGTEILKPLKEFLGDSDIGVRIEAVRALGKLGSIGSKRIILERISSRMFKEKDFEEKKIFYETLSRWKDAEVFDFLIGTLKKGSFLWWDKYYDEKACAAFCLGLLGNKDALPYLQKYADSKNKILREFAQSAMRRIEHGQ
jgi:HEAT repeat protein